MTEVLLDSAKPRRLLLAVLLAMAVATGLPATAGADGVWAVGDGAVAGTEDDALAARVQAAGVDRLLYLGDVYERGTASDYRQNYDPSWGRFKAIISPTPGNHEWGNRAVGYDPYWGALAPRTGDGHWYSFNHAGWHFVSLNSEEDTSSASAQVAWLRADLARYPGTCTVAFWHRPRYSGRAGGPRGDCGERPRPRLPAFLPGERHHPARGGKRRAPNARPGKPKRPTAGVCR